MVEPLEDRSLLSFSAPVSYDVAGPFLSPYDLVVADFNGDGTPDITQAGYDILLANGDGTFELQPPTNDMAWNPVAADINNDGRLDLVGRSRVLIGNGDGTFTGQAGIGLPAQFPPGYTGEDALPQSFGPAAAGDLNGDGNVDLAVNGVTSYDVFDYYDEYGNPVFTTVTHGYFNVLLGNGDGTFTHHWMEPGIRVYSVAVGDLNNDGKLDVVAGTTGVVILLGNGDGTLQPAQRFGFAQAERLELGDLNGDGALDVATHYPKWTPSYAYYLGNGDGTLEDALGYSGGNSSDLALADVNGDGALDLLMADTFSDEVLGESHVRVQLGRGDGTFDEVQIFYAGAAWFSGYLAVGDFNGDGFPDLALSNYYEDGGRLVKVMLNDGIWTPPAPPPAPPPPSTSISDVTLTEGHTGMRTATFGVYLSAAASQPVTVDFGTANGTAMAGSDYQAVSGTLTFDPGETGKIINVLVSGDRVVEWDETFFVNLTGATNATIEDGQGLGIIKEDDSRITIWDVTKNEGRKGKATLFTFQVTLSVAYDQPVTMSFRTVDGTAKTSDNDYVAKSGTLTFAPGETMKTITITVKGDSKREANETFYLDLFDNSSNSAFTNNRGVGTIWNDD